VQSVGREPLVAVITRTKDRPLFLERAAQSVLGQHFSDFVWVIVNDGGNPEAIGALVERHRAEIGDRVRVIHHPRSLGMQTAANAAISESSSMYVVIHDDDDTWDPRFLERTTAHLENTGAMGVVTASDLIIEQLDGQEITRLEKSRFHPEMRTISIYKMCWENKFPPIAFLFRRQVFKEIGYFDQALRGYGDWDFHLRFLEHYDIDYLPSEVLAFYHRRPEATGEQRNSVFRDDQVALADMMFNKWLRSDLERGRLGLGYVINALHNGPVNDWQTFTTIMMRIDEQADRVAKEIDEHSDKLADQVINSLLRVEDTMGHQHQGLVPVSHRVLRKLKRLFVSQ
jgi:glycosyltransferase involved in cell wall biosynthesis